VGAAGIVTHLRRSKGDPPGVGSVLSGRVRTLVGSLAIGEEEGWSALSSGRRYGGLIGGGGVG
jgi:hypothetical protein